MLGQSLSKLKSRSKVYTKALFLNKEIGLTDLKNILIELNTFNKNLKTLSSLQYSKNYINIINNLKITKYTSNLIKILLKNKLIQLIPFICEGIKVKIAELNNEKIVNISIAENNKKQISDIESSLKDFYKCGINLEIEEDKSLISGFVINVDSKTFDYSYNYKLKKIENAFK